MRYAFEGCMVAVYGFNRPNLHCGQPYCHFKSPSKFLLQVVLLARSFCRLRTWFLTDDVGKKKTRWTWCRPTRIGCCCARWPRWPSSSWRCARPPTASSSAASEPRDADSVPTPNRKSSPSPVGSSWRDGAGGVFFFTMTNGRRQSRFLTAGRHRRCGLGRRTCKCSQPESA